ncbi:MAG: hypothetical protein Q7T25_08295, partial [Sideroxyarcus sp.]|nr:hypothetical protein [Sideroxyarcus sp.]
QKQQIKRLQQIAGLQLDLRLNDLHAAARARQESLDRIAGLNMPPRGDLPPIAAAQADILYQRWADARRAEINQTLARQTAEWLEAQSRARRAFGQTQAMNALHEKIGK